MNPFSLPGPDFLGFYLILILVVLATVLVLRRRLGPGGRANRRLTDPYSIALLRDGPEEAIRVVVLALVERKLLTRSGTMLESAKGALAQVSDPAEHAIVLACVLPIEGWRLLTNETARAGFEPRQHELRTLGLAPTAALHLQHQAIALAGLAVLGATAGIKLVIALNTGHHNVAFLVCLTIGTVVVMSVIAVHRIWATPRGRTVLSDLKNLFGALRYHPVAGRPDETLFLAAVFGIDALTAPEIAVMRDTFRAPQQQSSSGCGSSSSCGSSGGSSCGGGGCGGCGS
jgi:uncharacterized protein (TIGR04222 family)